MIITQVNFLALGDGDDQALLGNDLHGFGLGHADFNAGLQHRRSQHEDDQQHQHHVHKRRDVDLRQRGLGAANLVGECHQRTPADTPVVRSIMFSSSSEKSSMRAPNSRMRWVKML